VLVQLAPATASVFANRHTNYFVGRTDVLLGQLKQARSYRSRDVYFSEHVFTSPFATALAVFLHEHSHVFGFDGQRGFSDSLTELLEEVVLHRQSFDALELRWMSIADSIKQSRTQMLESKDLITKITKLPKKILKKKLESLPVEILMDLVAEKSGVEKESDAISALKL
jgi:hypothetical protein